MVYNAITMTLPVTTVYVKKLSTMVDYSLLWIYYSLLHLHVNLLW